VNAFSKFADVALAAAARATARQKNEQDCFEYGRKIQSLCHALRIDDQVFKDRAQVEDVAAEAARTRDCLRSAGNAPDCCDFCGLHKCWITLRQCGHCKASRYCSESCQRGDWLAGHRETCRKELTSLEEA